MRAQAADAVLEVLNDDGVAQVVLTRGDARISVWRARGMAAAPAVAAGAGPSLGGHWVAWHHDVREDDRRRDVAKWIALRFVDAAGVVHEPSAPMTDRDRDRDGEEQSFEFPSLAVSADGSVALFGRGSHDMWRQDLGGSGFGPRQSLTDGSWGSRGRRNHHRERCGRALGGLA